jgi:hypothetical protein
MESMDAMVYNNKCPSRYGAKMNAYGTSIGDDPGRMESIHAMADAAPNVFPLSLKYTIIPKIQKVSFILWKRYVSLSACSVCPIRIPTMVECANGFKLGGFRLKKKIAELPMSNGELK